MESLYLVADLQRHFDSSSQSICDGHGPLRTPFIIPGAIDPAKRQRWFADFTMVHFQYRVVGRLIPRWWKAPDEDITISMDDLTVKTEFASSTTFIQLPPEVNRESARILHGYCTQISKAYPMVTAESSSDVTARLISPPPTRTVLLFGVLLERQVINLPADPQLMPLRTVPVGMARAVDTDERLSESGPQAILRPAPGVPKVVPPPCR